MKVISGTSTHKKAALPGALLKKGAGSTVKGN